jgi:methionine-rich copper-binding protein CopC
MSSCCLRQQAVAHQQIAQPVPAIDDARVVDAAAVEVDLPEAGAIRHRQAAALLPERQQLADVRQARLP